MLLRFEKEGDIKGIHSVHVQSFETDQEAKLVDDLRLSGLDLISLVAEENQKIIGHILFSPIHFLWSRFTILSPKYLRVGPKCGQGPPPAPASGLCQHLNARAEFL